MANRIQLRRDTAANWTRVNPVLEDGEPGLEIDTNYVKYGDGNTPWAALPYASTGSGSVSFDYSTVQEGSVGPDNVTSITGGDNTGVSLTSENWAQLMWVPNTANVTVANISQGPATFNWAYVDDEGFHIESNVDGVRSNWKFATNGNLELPLGGSIYEVPSPTFVGNAVVIEPAEGSDPNQKLMLYPTVNEGNHLHMTSGNLAITDIFLGSDHQYIRTRTDQGMTIGTGGGEQWAGWAWTFGANAVLSVPYEGLVRATDDSISLQTHDTVANVIHGVRLGTGGQLFLENTTDNVQWLQIDTFAGNTRFQSNGGVRIKSDAYGSEWSWTFANTGVLTTPGNVQVGTEGTYGNISFVDTISANNYVYANGVSILNGISGNYGDSNVAAYLSSGAIETAWIHGNLTVGNLTVTGNSSIINTESYVVEDNIIQMANANPADSIDLGFVAHRTVSSTLEHTGLIRDSSAGIWRLFSNVTAQPGSTVDFTNANYDVLQVGGLNAVNITTTGPVNFTSSPAPSVTPGIVWPSGFQTDIYGNTQVAAYLVDNPQGSTYSNTNVASYLSSSTLKTVANLAVSGSAPSSVTGSAGDTAGMIRVDSNYVYYCTSTFSPNSYTVGWEGSTGNTLFLTKGDYPTPEAGWTVTYQSYGPYTIQTVTDNGTNWQITFDGALGTPGGGTATLTDPDQPAIWKSIPLTTFQTAVASTYSNANVASYLPTYSGNIGAGNIVTTGATSGNISGANYISANVFQVSTGIFWANGTAWSSSGGGTTYSSTGAGNVTISGSAINLTLSGPGAVATGSSTAIPVVTTDAYGRISSITTAAVVAPAGTLSGSTLNSTVTASSLTSVGTLATLSVTGNVSTGNVSTTQVTATTGVYSGNVTAANIVTTGTYGNITNANVITANNIVVTGFGVTMASRPAFRVNGTGSTPVNTGTNIKGATITTAYNQGNYFNATTGLFTAPVAGIYMVGLNARVGTNNSTNQVAVLKNGLNTAGNVVCFWEADTNTGTATHFGVNGTVQLAVGDWLSANVLQGNIQFDQNNNWTVTYLG